MTTPVLPFDDRFVDLSLAAGTTALDYDFELKSEAGLTVLRTRAGVRATLVNGTDYDFLSGLGDVTGGTITLLSASLAGDRYVLVGLEPIERASDLLDSNAFSAGRYNEEGDKLAIFDQEQRRDIDRAMKSDYGQAGLSIDTDAVTAGKTLMRGEGDDIVPGPDAAEISAAEGYAESALASKNTAVAAAAVSTAAAADAAAAAAAAQQRFVRVDVVDVAEADPSADYEAGDTIDGVALTAGDIILRATDGGDPADGLYIASTAGAASRSTQFDGYDDYPGSYVSVVSGSSNADTLWRCTSALGGTLGVTDIVFSQFSAGTGAGGGVADRTALAALTPAAGDIRFLAEAGRKGQFEFDAADLSSQVTADPQQALYVAPASDATGASGAWVRVRGTTFEASWFGFSTGATAANNATYLNAAITLANALGGGIILIGEGSFPVETIQMKANVTLQGLNRATSILADTRADSNPVITSSDNSVSMLWSKVLDLKITKANATGGTVIDMTSWQWCEVARCWITAASVAGVQCIRMRGLYTAGPVFTTEGTYNHVHENYMGLCAFGIRMGPNANTCWIKHNRIQPSVTGGKGIYLGTSGAGETAVAGFPNQVVIDSNSVEFPGGLGVSGIQGVWLEAVCDDITVANNRFEGGALADAIYVTAGATGIAHGNHASGNTARQVRGINSLFVSIDPDEAAGYRNVAVAKGSISGIDGSARGTLHGMTAARGSTGVYDFTFDFEMPDTNYVINATPVGSAAVCWRTSIKQTTGFTITTMTVGTTPAVTDVLQLDVRVDP